MKRLLLLLIISYSIGCVASMYSKYPPMGFYRKGLSGFPYIDFTINSNSGGRQISPDSKMKDNILYLPNFIPAPIENKSEKINYIVKKFHGLRIGANFRLKSTNEFVAGTTRANGAKICALPENYQIKVFFENLTDKNITINPSLYIVDKNGILKYSDYDAFLYPLYAQANIEPINVAIGPAPTKPDQNTREKTKGTVYDESGKILGTYKESSATPLADAMGNLNRAIQYEREMEKRRIQQAVARNFVAQANAAKTMALEYILYISNNKLKDEYTIPPKTKVVAVAYFENVDSSDDIELKVDIGNSNTITFSPGNFTLNWKISLVHNGIDMSDQPFHPTYNYFNDFTPGKYGMFLKGFWWDMTRIEINIMDIKSIEYTPTGKRWAFTGTLQERYNTISEIDSYQESLFTSK